MEPTMVYNAGEYFTDPRCMFGSNKIQVQTEYPYYEPGNTIRG